MISMAEIFSLPASTSLLAEINAVGAPNRLKAQDGTIGDRAHMERPSDHNLDEIGNTGSSSDSDSVPEVHARDVDARGPWIPGWSMARIVAIILGRCRAWNEPRLKYIIFDGWIYEASNNWAKRKYTGADQHHEHAHFSFRYGSGSGTSNPENITAPWGLVAALEAEDEMDAAETAKVLDDTLRGVGPKVGDHAAGDIVRRWNVADGSEVPLTDPNPYMSLAYTAGFLGRQVAVIRNGVTALLAKEQGDEVDEGAIAALVLAGLTTERLAAAITSAGLTAQAIADAIPDDLAEQVADVLGRRISGTA